MKNLIQRSILTAILLIAAITGTSQNTAYLKVANKGSFEKIERLSAGGYITVGYDSAYKIQVIRYDASFVPQWKIKFDDANISPIAPQIVEANDGNFFFMTASYENTGSTLIVKLSPTGSVLWQKKYYLTSGNMNSEALSKAAAGDNGFIFGGGQCTLTNYLIKCDQDGTIEWQKQYIYPLSTGVTVCWSILPEASNYIVSSGYNINSLLTMKIDGSGNVLSHTAYTYTGMQIVPTRIVKLAQTGGYAIMGNYNSSNDNKTEFVAIYDQNMALLSFNELTVTYTQFCLWDIAPVSNGKNVVVVGSIYDGSAFTMAMIKISGSGNLVWYKRSAGNVGSNTNVEFRGITVNGNYTISAGHGFNEGSVIAVIDSNGTGLCNDVAFSLTNVHRTLSMQSSSITPISASALSASVAYTNTNQASYNKYIYCGSLSSIENSTEATTQLSLYPNPANDALHVEWSMESNNAACSLSLFDTQGKLVISKRLTGTETSTNIDTRNLDNGLYLLRLNQGEKILANKKVMIRH
jgi:hypothetical protein